MSIIENNNTLYLSVEQLLAKAVANKEGVIAANGAFSTSTGHRTGRSPKDRFIVKQPITENSVDWGSVNQPISPDIFDALWQKASSYIADREHYAAALRVGADKDHSIAVNVVTEFAWHNLFAHHLFIRDPQLDRKDTTWTILNTPGLATCPDADQVNSDGVVIINFEQQAVLIIGMRYAGEMKKAMFTVLNFLCPQQDTLPMHCAANEGADGSVALFFGLSGTGKTTLSADPERRLIGDDEHGWSKEGVFNFEGGCYAKCIHLSKAREPVIWDAIREGAVMENVVLNSQGEPDYDNDSLTQNSRAAYPRDFIEGCAPSNQGATPNTIIFLCCDLYGVLPPVSLLTLEQAAYYFLSGYTALVGSTEMGSAKGVNATFSTCFGAPFFPRNPSVYADLLMKRITESGAQVALVNTGWTGGGYGVGSRFSIPTTRAIITALVNNRLPQGSTTQLPGFNLAMPNQLPGVESSLLDPRNAWSDQLAYQEQSKELISRFVDNFKRFDHVSDAVIAAGPCCFVET